MMQESTRDNFDKIGKVANTDGEKVKGLRVN